MLIPFYLLAVLLGGLALMMRWIIQGKNIYVVAPLCAFLVIGLSGEDVLAGLPSLVGELFPAAAPPARAASPGAASPTPTGDGNGAARVGRMLGFAGLALATSLAAIANATLCVWIMRGELGGLGGRALAAVVVKLAVASAAMVGAIELVRPLLPAGTVAGGVLMQLVALGGAIGVGVSALVATAYLLGIEEVMRLLAHVRDRLSGRDSPGRAEPA